MKKFCSLVLFLTMLLPLLGNAVHAEDDIKVTLNGNFLSFDQPPILQDNRVLVPMRTVFEALGADVYWIEEYQVVGVVKNDIKIIAEISKADILKFKGSTVLDFQQEIDKAEKTKIEIIESDVAPQIIDGRTYIPLRVISEALGVHVDWESKTRTVILKCSEEFIKQKNQDKVFMDEFQLYLDKNSELPLDYSTLETSSDVPDGIKELSRKICHMTNAVEVCNVIIKKYGKPTKDLGGDGLFVPAWEVEGGEITFIVFSGVTYSNEKGNWNLMPVYSKFSEVLSPELEIFTLEDNDIGATRSIGNTMLNGDGTYQFDLTIDLKEDFGKEFNDKIKDFANNSFFTKNPKGTWNLKFEKDYNEETDITTLKNNELIATISFMGNSKDKATTTLLIKKGSYGLDFVPSQELRCSIDSQRIQCPFTDGILQFL